MKFSVYVVCKCGWYDEPSFGSRFFTETRYPVCPRCGRSTREAKRVVGRRVNVGRWWRPEYRIRPLQRTEEET